MADAIAEMGAVLASATTLLAEALNQPSCLRCIELEVALQVAEDEIASLESLLADAGEALNAAE